jgi:hypothetical protein
MERPVLGRELRYTGLINLANISGGRRRNDVDCKRAI